MNTLKQWTARIAYAAFFAVAAAFLRSGAAPTGDPHGIGEPALEVS